ncbi:MAG: metallophosphoesterase [Saprospiraceae bacterium]
MTNHFFKYALSLGALLMLASCANYKMHQKEITTTFPSDNDISEKPTHSVFLIGDVGEGLKEETNPTLQLLKEHLDKAEKKSSVIFLGNNVGPTGMTSKSDTKKRKRSEQQLNAQLSVLENYKGRPIFIAGTNDWKREGLKGLKRQEKYIESALNEGIPDDDDWKDYFQPDDGCPGPEVIEVNDQLVIILIDSYWWLQDWEEQPNINNDCDVKSRAAFALVLEDVMKDYKFQNVVIATHHSIKSSGPHGGKFTLKNHLFPLTSIYDNAYVPLPGVGSLALMLRNAGIYKEDASNPNYRVLTDAMIEPAKKYGEFIFVSGHENSLEYHRSENQHFVVSGSGSKATATAKKKDAYFSYGHTGFSKIDFYEDGSAWVEFWTPTKDGKGKKVYRKQMKGPLPIKPMKQKFDMDFALYESGQDSIVTFPSTRSIKPLKDFATFMLGKRHRKVYLTENKFPTLDLSDYKGGLKVIKKGGGKQTNSLRLEAPGGKEYVMRSLTKDTQRGVPYPFNQLAVVNFLFNESFLGVHCYAPPTLGTMADAIKVYHTNPNIFYIPKQPVLGAYNKNFGDEVYIVEERPSGSWPEAPFFGNAEKFKSTTKLMAKLEKNHNHIVDQKWLARSRLFDMLIGDIDRHGDQWRWTVAKTEDDKKIYRPIPRDRDNAYCTYDGLAFKMLRPYHYIVRMLGVYRNEVPDPQWTYYNARHFDHNFLNELSLEDWLKEASYIQEQLTDEIVELSIKKMPKQIYDMTGPYIEQVIKARRNNLQETATRMYGYLARKSIVRGTNKKELFEIVRLDDEQTDVKMWDTNDEREKQELLYHRVFKTSDTKELYIYGLGNDDFFEISGEVNKGIEIYVVGGGGKDVFEDVSKVKGIGKKGNFYDTKKGNKVEVGSETRDRRSNQVANNTFEYLDAQFDSNVFLPFPLLGYNTREGFSVGFLGIYRIHKFNKNPFSQEHKFRLNYAFATQGVDMQYDATFFEATTHWDFVLHTDVRSNRYAFNYFGLGNESDRIKSRDLDFYQVRQSLVYLDMGFQRRFASDIGVFAVKPLLQWTDIIETEDRFISSNNNDLTTVDLESKWYTGAAASLSFANVDKPASPRNGFSFDNNFKWQKSITGTDREFTTFSTQFTAYKSIDPKKKLILASQVGSEMIWGDYDFFFAPTLGQEGNIRGYNSQRFRGATTFYHISDLRLALGEWNNAILPFSFGITGSFDYGRIFDDGNTGGESDYWHASYGGSLWVAPLNIAILSLSYNHTLEDGGRFQLAVGHAF